MEPEEEAAPTSSFPNNIMNRYYDIFPNARPIAILRAQMTQRKKNHKKKR